MTRPPCAPSRLPIAFVLAGALAFGTVMTAQELQFEVASIKLSRDSTARGITRQLPDGTFITTNISIRNLLASAWRREELDHWNLPAWAMRNGYDVTVKPPAGTSPARMREMWRALFRDRFKLEVHTEMRDTPIYALVVARTDRRLGPQLRPSPHDCAALAAAAATAPPPPPATPPTDDEVMGSCRSWFVQGRMITGGMLLSNLARSLGGQSGRIVEDRTGLEGYYAITLTYAEPVRTGGDVSGAPGDAPSIFTALEEQLGLKLEPARTRLQMVVIDHIEPPTEN
jgi:uncharacterized protein (TIGR03435 family)